MAKVNEFEDLIGIDPKKRVGEQVGNYRLTGWLGRGGSGDVYVGEHIYLKKQGAIKILHLHLSEKAQKEFLNEACTIARLDHPNIVHVLDYGVENGTPFLVMAYAPNGSLRQRFPEGTRVPLEQVVPLVQQMASALDYAHQQRLIHRDVKPENMLIGAQNQALLSDFGLVLLAQNMRSQAANAMAGTALYMAPELLERGKVHFASDQYALGVVTYEWLCGQRPFTGSSFIQIGAQHVLVKPPSLCERVPSLPPAVERVVFKALAKNRAQRYENVIAFANALRDACKDASSTVIDNVEPQPSSPSVKKLPVSAETSILPEVIKPIQPSPSPGNIWQTVLLVMAVVAVLAAGIRLSYNIASSHVSIHSTGPAPIKYNATSTLTGSPRAMASASVSTANPTVGRGTPNTVTSSVPSISPTSAPLPTPTVTPSTSYEAEAESNTNNGTKIFSCNLCSGGLRVGWISYTIFLQFNNVNVNHGGDYTLRIYYINSIPNRVTSALVSVNGGPNVMVPGIQTLTVNCCDNIPPQVTQMTIRLQAGNNTIKISSPTDYAPDIDRIVV